jgi:hypothetical protein
MTILDRPSEIEPHLFAELEPKPLDATSAQTDIHTIELRWAESKQWLPPLACTRVETVPIKPEISDFIPQDGQRDDATDSDAEDNADSVRATITRLRDQLQKAQTTAEAERISRIEEFSSNPDEYPGPKLTERIQTVAQGMYTPEKPDGTGFTHAELFEWLAERNAETEAKKQTEATRKPSVETAGFPLSLDEAHKTYRFPFGRKLEQFLQKKEERAPHKKPNSLLRKLSEKKARNNHEFATFSNDAVERTKTLNELIHYNEAFLVKDSNFTNSALMIRTKGGLASLAKSNPQAVKSLVRRASATVTVATNREDARNLTVYLSRNVLEPMPRIKRETLKRLPRLGARLLAKR